MRFLPIEDLVSDQEIINLVLQGYYELSDSTCANDEEVLSKSISYREAHLRNSAHADVFRTKT